MTDEPELAGFDPYDMQDAECARLSAHFRALDSDDWAQPSGCAGWSRHDVLAHLVAIAEYFSACLGGSVKSLMQRYIDAGATSLDEFNAAGVAAGVGTDSMELLNRWNTYNERNRAGFRAADGTDIDSSVGTYPCRRQAFHAAFEYAIHANDVDALVGDDEFDVRQDRLAWIARFALTEVKPDSTVELSDGLYTVKQRGAAAVFDRETFVAGVAGRPLPGGRISEADLALLSLGY